jgi:hypothetical protein
MARVFISGDNPQWHTAPMRRNNAMEFQLLHDLHRSGAKDIARTRLINKKTGYNENGWSANLPVMEAVRLGKIYEQKAILVYGQGNLDLKTLKVNPVTHAHHGRAARARDAFVVVMKKKPEFLSYDIDFGHTRRLRA